MLVFPKPERLRECATSSHAQVGVTKTMSGSSVVVGIDVASQHVDVTVLGAPFRAERFTNDVDGHTALLAAVAPLKPQLVVMEATGG